MRRPIPPGLRLVVKVGSSSLTSDSGGIDAGRDRARRRPRGGGDRGRISRRFSSRRAPSPAGCRPSDLTKRPQDVAGLQVAAAVGQSRLMERYTACFRQAQSGGGPGAADERRLEQSRSIPQCQDRPRSHVDRRGSFRSSTRTTPSWSATCRLGGNDILAAAVSHLVGAGLLLILSDTEGLFSADPRLGEAELLGAVRHTDEILDKLAGAGPLGSGGVATKVAAARMAAWSGVPTVVASAVADRVVARVVAGEDIGTWVDPRPERLPARKLWIAFGLPSSGSLTIDDGAVAALVERAKSLLPVGVVDVEGLVSRGSRRRGARPERATGGQGSRPDGSHDSTGLIGKRSATRGDPSRRPRRPEVTIRSHRS